MGKRKAVYGVLVGKPEGKRPLAKQWHRGGNYIEMGLGEGKWDLGLH
jgi:hypothetical protein